MFDQLVTLVALNRDAYSLCSGANCTMPPGFSAPQLIRARPNAIRIFKDPLDVWGFRTSCGGQMYEIYRGTQDPLEWAEDMLAIPMDFPHQCGFVHRGFGQIFDGLDIPPAVPNTIYSGHSLGSSLATLRYAGRGALGGKLITFAGPRVGSEEFAQCLAGTTRVVNDPDRVPHVPTSPPCAHGGDEFRVYGPGSPTSFADLLAAAKLAHSLDSYLAGIQRAA